MMKRRDFLRGGLAAGLAGALPLTGPHPASAAGTSFRNDGVARRFGPARKIIFFAYDGFSFGDLGTARYFAQRHLDGRRLTLETLLARSASGANLTHSLSSIVTDSAAASTAWATGQKVVNRSVSMHADGTPLTTLMDLARGTGRATGLITTTRLTHATPAAWVARIDNRDLEDEIALQYLEFAPDVLLGGGSRHFGAATRADGRDLFADFAATGFQVLRTPEDLQRASGSRLLGSFMADHLAFEIDRIHGNVAAPSLAEMVRVGLDVLDGSVNGFLLQIEAGRVDHANHQNDPAAMVWDVIAADDALVVALDFVERNPDTLLIMASDHATGAGAVYGAGAGYNASTAGFDRLSLRRASQEFTLRLLGARPTAADVREATQSLLATTLTEAESETLAEALGPQRTALAHPRAHGRDRGNNFGYALTAAAAADHPRLTFNYATGAHTAGPVPILAYGAGVAPAPLGLVDNTELFSWLAGAMEADFRNPAPAPVESAALADSPLLAHS
jgi:alkaline phosphatase